MKRSTPRKLRDRRQGAVGEPKSPYARYAKKAWKYPSREVLAAKYPSRAHREVSV